MFIFVFLCVLCFVYWAFISALWRTVTGFPSRYSPRSLALVIAFLLLYSAKSAQVVCPPVPLRRLCYNKLVAPVFAAVVVIALAYRFRAGVSIQKSLVVPLSMKIEVFWCVVHAGDVSLSCWRRAPFVTNCWQGREIRM
jgi:hypothetical protein